jgi:hypothetical protein
MDFSGIMGKILGVKQGGVQNIAEAYDVLSNDRKKQEQIKRFGEYTLPNMVQTQYGAVDSSGGLDEFADMSRRGIAPEQYHQWLGENNGNTMGGMPTPEPFTDDIPMGEYPSLDLGVGFGEGVGIGADYMREVPQGLQGSVQGVQGSRHTSPELITKITAGRQPVQDIVVDEGTIKKYVDNARKWAGTLSADPRLTYRQKDTAAQNADYVGRYVEAIMRLAPYYDLPPKTMASMLMEESGWGGQRFDGNLGGYGFLDGGEDMGYRFKADTIEEQAAKYLEQVAKFRYKGSRSPEDFHKRGYNPHKEYPGKVRSVMNMLEK